jgi:hypothetical protein
LERRIARLKLYRILEAAERDRLGVFLPTLELEMRLGERHQRHQRRRIPRRIRERPSERIDRLRVFAAIAQKAAEVMQAAIGNQVGPATLRTA